MKKSLKRILLAILIIILAFIILIISNIVYCYNTIVVKEYSISDDKLNTDLRIALIADVHLKEFGKDNIDLLNIIDEQKPDIIVVAGDLTIKASAEYQPALTLLKQLQEIAPTYYSLGNHELPLLDSTELEKDVRATGVHLLINQSEYFEKDGEKILIGGIKQYPYFDSAAHPEESTSEEKYYLDSFLEQEKESYGILICHYPECFIWKFSEYDIDLMLSGHTHGGLIRLPGIGGVIAPEQGLFPKYDMGLFESDTATMVITAGLANSNIIPRINNPGEVCMVLVNNEN